MNLTQTCLFLCWTLLIPAAAGNIIPADRSRPFPVIGSYVQGWLLLFAAAEALTLPMIALSASLTALTVLYAVVSLILAVLGMRSLIRDCREHQRNLLREFVQDLKNLSPWTVLAAVLILAQIVMVCTYAHMDADDSFYVGMAVTDVHTDTIFSVNPYTGMKYTAKTFQSRYVLSAFPAFLAVLSKLSGGVDPVILAHKRLAAPLFVLAYAVLFRTAQVLFPKDKHGQGRLMLFASVFVWFSAYSVYNRENFMMVRIWQGKAVLAAVIIPAILYYGITVFALGEEREPRIMVFLTSAAGCLMTMLVVVAAPIGFGICLLIGWYRRRKLFPLLAHYLLGISPCIVIGVLYFLIR